MSIKLHSGSVLPRLIEGISPEVKLESVDGGVRMTVTTKSGSKSIIIPKGEIGETGPQGLKGDTGDTGIGITDIVQNEDGTLTIELDDGSNYLTEPLKGETGDTGPQGPKGDTGTGIQSTVLNQNYTLTINYTDGTSTTTSSIRGEQGAQGIQGIQGPKGDTGAKGDQGIQGEKGDKGDKGDTGATGAQGPKGDTGLTGATPQLSIGTVETLDPGDDATVTISGTMDAPVLNFGIPQGDPGEVTQADLDAAVADIEQTIGTVPTGKTIQGQVDELYTGKADVIVSSASGSIATFTDGADGMPLKSLSVAIEPVQEGEGDPSPENVRPITGWDGVKVTRAGKNLFDKSNINEYRGYVGDGEIKYNSGQRIVWIPCKPNTEYTLQKIAVANGSSDRFSVFWTDSTPALGTQCYGLKEKHNGFVIGEKYSFSLTTGATAKFIGCWLSRNTEYAESLNTFQIEHGSVATAYEPYSGETIEYEFPQAAGTVYGGTLDVVTGVLTVDRKSVTIDGSAEWTMYKTGKFYASVIEKNEAKAVTPQVGLTAYKSNQYLFYGDGASTSTQIGTDKRFYGQRAFGRFWVYDSTYSTLEEFTSALNTTPLVIVYPLETPIQIPLAPTEITTLLGTNNIFSDAGDVSVTYPADTKAYIDNQIANTRKLIAGIETDFTASKAYAVGDMLIIGNDLYKVIASIASGATITVGTNVTKTTVAEQLIALANA